MGTNKQHELGKIPKQIAFHKLMHWSMSLLNLHAFFSGIIQILLFISQSQHYALIVLYCLVTLYFVYWTMVFDGKMTFL
jgi:hypothetical protein